MRFRIKEDVREEEDAETDVEIATPARQQPADNSDCEIIVPDSRKVAPEHLKHILQQVENGTDKAPTQSAPVATPLPRASVGHGQIAFGFRLQLPWANLGRPIPTPLQRPPPTPIAAPIDAPIDLGVALGSDSMNTSVNGRSVVTLGSQSSESFQVEASVATSESQPLVVPAEVALESQPLVVPQSLAERPEAVKLLPLGGEGPHVLEASSGVALGSQRSEEPLELQVEKSEGSEEVALGSQRLEEPLENLRTSLGAEGSQALGDGDVAMGSQRSEKLESEPSLVTAVETAPLGKILDLSSMEKLMEAIEKAPDIDNVHTLTTAAVGTSKTPPAAAVGEATQPAKTQPPPAEKKSILP